MATVVVTLIAPEGKALAGNFFAGVTLVTLVMADCGVVKCEGCAPLATALSRKQGDSVYPEAVVTGNSDYYDNRRERPSNRKSSDGRLRPQVPG